MMNTTNGKRIQGLRGAGRLAYNRGESVHAAMRLAGELLGELSTSDRSEVAYGWRDERAMACADF